jgi:hypothetical protein
VDIRTFDRAAVLAALEPPRFRDGETEYVGRILSALEWFALEEQLRTAGPLDGVSVHALMRAATELIFPAPAWWQMWRRPWRPTVWRLVDQLPFADQMTVFQSFVAAQAKAHYGTTPGQETKNPIPTSASS